LKMSDESEGFVENWEQGVSSQRWVALRKKWGQGNNGVLDSMIKLERDNVNGVEKNVVSLYGNGDLYEGDIRGIKKEGAKYLPCNSGKRVGAVLATKNSFASGEYQVDMKINLSKENTLPKGMCIANWCFHYEEHYCKKGDATGNELNPNDPLYIPRLKMGNPCDGWYSVVNSEIDWPELGHSSDLNTGWFNTFESEAFVNTLKFPLEKACDGRYHSYGLEWETDLVKLPSLRADQVISCGKYMYIKDLTSSEQGNAVVQKNGSYYLYHGKKVSYYFDGIKLGETSKWVSPISTQLHFGVWFPSWCGAANWTQCKVSVSSVKVTPLHREGDVCSQPETFPNDGMVPISLSC